MIPNGVKLSLCSLDGEDGFPGEVWAECNYTLDYEKNDLTVEYKAVTDKPTPIDITNHVYLNLNGHNSGTKVYNHTFKFSADKFLDFVPEDISVTGKINDVEGTKYDFRTEAKLEDRIDSEGRWPEHGYDNFLILSEKNSEQKNVATYVDDS